MFGLAFGNEGNPRPSGGGFSSSRRLLDDILDFCTFREPLVKLKNNLDRCFQLGSMYHVDRLGFGLEWCRK